jgi:hypothetical protein
VPQAPVYAPCVGADATISASLQVGCDPGAGFGTQAPKSPLIHMDEATPILSWRLPSSSWRCVACRRRRAKLIPIPGSNPIDDKRWDVLQHSPDDLTREESSEPHSGAKRASTGRIGRLMWIGRDDAEPEECEKTIELAGALNDGPTPR